MLNDEQFVLAWFDFWFGVTKANAMAWREFCSKF